MSTHVLKPTRMTSDGKFYSMCSCGWWSTKCGRREDATRAGNTHRRAADKREPSTTGLSELLPHW